MLVAIPTAMPTDPLASRQGKRLGSTTGSFLVSSKLPRQSMVSLSISWSIWRAILLSRASV